MRRRLLVTDRRKFLGFLSGTSLMFLPALRALRAGGTEELPKRLFIMVQSNGGIVDAFSPTGSRFDFELSNTLAPLAPYKDRCSFFDGLFVVDGEAYGQIHLRQLYGVLTGRQLRDLEATGGPGIVTGPSIDHVLSQALGTKLLPLNQRNHSHGYNIVSHRGEDDPIVPLNPVGGFDYVFGDVDDLDQVPAAQQAEYLERLRAEKRSVLDVLYGEFESIRPHLSAAERSKLELHMEGVREIERSLDDLTIPQCTLPNADDLDVSGFDALTTANLDLTFHAMQCGLSNVVTLLPVGGGDWGPVFSFMGYNDSNHEMSHRTKPEHYDQQVQVQRWYIEKFAYFIEKLASTPEGNGTMLDNTLCLYTTEMGDGDPHNVVDLQTVLCGNIEGYFKTGQYLPMKKSNTGVLSAIADAFGLGATPFGDPSFAVGPFDELRA